MINPRRSAAAAAALALAVAGVAVAASPASAARDASQRDSDSLHPSVCSDGVATLAVDYWQDSTTGHVVSIHAINGTGRRISFTDIYASSGHHRFESYDVITNTYLTPGQDVYAGGHGPNHRLPFYVVGEFRATTNYGCTGTISVRLDPGLASRGKHPATVNASVTWHAPTHRALAAV